MRNSRFQFWIFFGFSFAVIPIIVSIIFIKGSTDGGITWENAFKAAISKGELFLACGSLLGTNIGDLIKEECKDLNLRNTFIGITLIIFFIAVAMFAMINGNPKFDRELSVSLSLLILVCSFITCVVSILIKRKDK